MSLPPAEPHPPRSLRRQQPFACEPGKSFSQSHHETERMPSIYHLHRTPSEPDIGLSTPPASPGRTFAAPYAKLPPEDMAGLTCSCGHAMYDGKGYCPACYDRRSRRSQRSTSTATAQSLMQPLTPPPSQPASPREFVERGRALTASTGAQHRQSSAAAVMNGAFSSQEAHPSIFASSLSGPRPSRTSSSASVSLASPVRSSIIKHSDDRKGPIIGQLAPPPAARASNGGGSNVREHSPLAAGFARLNQKDDCPSSQHSHVNHRREVERSSLDLHARMFD
ncbi:hypothetical protein B0A50_07887 [Salinomyces thailandicus]|uniref:Uncharacterized protein n=1 Tax=Salinomyces thailandicus TaxID=706561 RepID=A0A4U0TM64_9PEZI|nr:hypothetical protein B0A50_07887 [Salinomyces thailandica]